MATSESSETVQKVNEFNDGRKVPPYEWKTSIYDWWKHSRLGGYSDSSVETHLLSFLPFFPKSDGRRSAKLIDTDIGNGQYIHEFYIENTEKPATTQELSQSSPVRDIVLVHGYAASLGLFFDNYDRLSSIPGVRVHAIDMLGFGFSSRPKYPKIGCESVADIQKNEDWFIDSLEEWRKRRGIEKFVLIGHSFGGYLSCAYAMKYNHRIGNGKQNMIQKLILLSPVGVERHVHSLLKGADTPSTQVSKTERSTENNEDPELAIARELTSNQEDIVTGNEARQKIRSPASNSEPKSFGSKVLHYLWEHHTSPFSIVRRSGPFRSKMISRWTTHRFSHIYYTDPEKFQSIHDYFYRIFNASGSGEYAITRILAPGALARTPLLDRCPKPFVEMKLPTLWAYGDKDWMNREAGQEMVAEINELSRSTNGPNLASFKVLKNAGHHLYLDNPEDFGTMVLDFLRA